LSVIDTLRGIIKAPAPGDIGATVPLTYDIGNASYPDVSFGNLASEGYIKSEIVHACIRELAVGAASAQYQVIATSTDGGTVAVERGPLFDLMKRPNPAMSWYQFIEEFVTYLQVAGNVYTYKERDRGNRVTALQLLRPDRMRIIPGSYGAESYIYEVDGRDYMLPKDDVCHLALPNPSGDLYGLSPLQTLARTVNLDSAMTDFAKVYFQNAGVPSGLLKLKRRLQTQEEAATIRSRWRSQFGGKNNFHRVAILDEDADYQQMASAPKDMALSELHNLTESRICSVFQVPAILVGANVGLQRSTYSNYREARMAFHSETLEPMVARILDHLNFYITDREYGGPEYITVNWAAMRASLDDRTSETTRVNALFTGGVITLNEARSTLGFEAIAGGDVRRIQASMFEVGEGEDVPVAVGAASIEEGIRIEDYKTGPALIPPLIHPSMAVDAPDIKAPRVAPRAGMLRRQMLEDREELTDELTPKIQRYFRGLRNRVDGILGRYMDRDITDMKDLPFDADRLIPDGEFNQLSPVLRAAILNISKKTFDAINGNGLAGTLAWSEKLPLIQSLGTSAPQRAQLIHSTTSEAIKRAVTIALRGGYSVEQLAKGVPADGFPGLRSIMTETEKRARLIARTEVMRTQNKTSVGFYKEQGFNWVRADDVDGDENDTYIDPSDPYGFTCAERHNQIYSVEDAARIDDHPNGTLNWQPMPRDFNPEEVV
jgi:HK97 family phage portal protein